MKPYEQKEEKLVDKGEIPSRAAVEHALQVRTISDRETPQARRRPRFGSSKLGVDCTALHEQGYYCHWINNYPGRVQDALSSGYEFVGINEVELATAIGAPSADAGDKISRRVGTLDTGADLVAYLMKIPRAWKEENDAYYQQRADAIDRNIKTGKVANTTTGDSGAFYDQSTYLSRNR